MYKTYYLLYASAVILFDLCLVVVYCDIEYNTINEDGSYQFRHTNNDEGRYYHSARGTPDNRVQGRYGSLNPATQEVEETVYTAGPRGFRVNGPSIHRKMDVAQYPPRPIGSPDDPLADPYDDPSYSFSYGDAEQSRSENSDSTGRVRGLYSYRDDEGVRHDVRYAAGAGTGFEVSNSVPDNPIEVGYASPLYKAPPITRGKMTVQRGPDGSYKLIASGPDHRRAESRSPDGVVRGTYSFLDDKGIQRTVEYIAGAGIGYRVLKNKIGPGTHVNNQVLDFRLNDPNFKLASDFGTGGGPASALSGLGGGSSGGGGGGSSSGGGKIRGGAGRKDYLKPDSSNTHSQDDDNDNDVENRGDGDDDGNIEDDADIDADSDVTNTKHKKDRMGIPSRGTARYPGGTKSSSDRGYMYDRDSPKKPIRGRKPLNKDKPLRRPLSSNRRKTTNKINGSGETGGGYMYEAPSNSNYNPSNDDISSSLPPLVTANRNILEIDRNREWVEEHRDSTVIKNVGKWYLSLPPGHSVRAHVQNIDILPLGGRRVPSPAEALRQDEIADMVASIES